jgi:hypothetical protein
MSLYCHSILETCLDYNNSKIDLDEIKDDSKQYVAYNLMVLFLYSDNEWCCQGLKVLRVYLAYLAQKPAETGNILSSVL